jgi:hypothetical protein
MKELHGLDSKLTKHCIEANIRNNLTSFYHLLLKKKKLEGVSIRSESRLQEQNRHKYQEVESDDPIAIIIQDPMGNDSSHKIALGIQETSLRVSKLSRDDE